MLRDNQLPLQLYNCKRDIKARKARFNGNDFVIHPFTLLSQFPRHGSRPIVNLAIS